MGEQEVLAEAVAERLRSLGVNAVSWDSGGGIVGVGIARGGAAPADLRFFFGTAGEVWAGEVLGDDGEVEAGLATTVPSSTHDSREVAAAILSAIADLASQFRRNT